MKLGGAGWIKVPLAWQLSSLTLLVAPNSISNLLWTPSAHRSDEMAIAQGFSMVPLHLHSSVGWHQAT